MKNNLAINDLLLLDFDLAVKWNDDRESYIPLKILRDHCPCAFCSGEKDVFGNVYKGPNKNLEEIAYNEGFISKQQLSSLIDEYPKNDYVHYLQSILDD